MNDLRDRDRIEALVRNRPKDRRLVCPCGSADIELRGKPAPQYRCGGCGTVHRALADLEIT